MRILLFAAALALALAAPAAAQKRPVNVAPNAPKDVPVAVPNDTVQARIFALMEPQSVRARAAYPEAKARFLAGLPKGQSFFAVTRLRDEDGRWEQVFIAVDGIKDGKITGRIWNDINVVRGFRAGQSHTFPEAELVDWMITRPDGSEEGNFIGKFIDEMRRTGRNP
jgi:uncharacterized protein YegJ (DUF2314 family)